MPHIYCAVYQGGEVVGDFARVADVDLSGDVDALKERVKASRSRLHDVDLCDMTFFGPWEAKPSEALMRAALASVDASCDPAANLGALIGDKERAYFIVRVTKPPPASAAAGRAAMSITEAVGPTFEHEAREVLRTVFRDVCPWAHDHSALLSRTLDRGGNAREADVMCYIEGDSLGPCTPSPVHGVAVAGIPADAQEAVPLPAVALAATTRFSPTDATRCGPHKYFLAEVYSGANDATRAAKIQQLETLCEYLTKRWVDQHDDVGPVADITALVGAAALVYSAGEAPRRAVLGDAQALVERIAKGPHLLRLLRARRLLVIVLDKTQSPATYFQRSVASEIGRLSTVPEELETLREGQKTLRQGQETLREGQETLREGQETLREGQETLREGQALVGRKLDVLLQKY